MVSYVLSFSLDDPVLKGYLYYSSLLIGKTLMMSTLTGIQRHRKKVFASPEDTQAIKDSKCVSDDPDIERIRRAHLNDLENIPMFLFTGAAYLLTDPEPTLALNLFRSYTLLRFIHTFVYAIYVVPQPARGLAYGFAHLINIYMLGTVVAKFFYP